MSKSAQVRIGRAVAKILNLSGPDEDGIRYPRKTILIDDAEDLLEAAGLYGNIVRYAYERGSMVQNANHPHVKRGDMNSYSVVFTRWMNPENRTVRGVFIHEEEGGSFNC